MDCVSRQQYQKAVSNSQSGAFEISPKALQINEIGA
jgi:hypothetical protein